MIFHIKNLDDLYFVNSNRTGSSKLSSDFSYKIHLDDLYFVNSNRTGSSKLSSDFSYKIHLDDLYFSGCIFRALSAVLR